MQEIKAIIRPERMNNVLHEPHGLAGLPGITISIVRLVGRRIANEQADQLFGENEMAKIEMVVEEALVQPIVQAIKRGARTGRAGDGKVFVLPVTAAIDVKTGETDDPAP